MTPGVVIMCAVARVLVILGCAMIIGGMAGACISIGKALL